MNQQTNDKEAAPIADTVSQSELIAALGTAFDDNMYLKMIMSLGISTLRNMVADLDKKTLELSSAVIKSPSWQPINTAPQTPNSRILLYYPNKGTRKRPMIVCGCWNETKSQPHWAHDKDQGWGVQYCLHNTPTHWMPLLAPPEST